MERIKEAISKARETQHLGSSIRLSPKGRAWQVEKETLDFSYEQTRVVKPDPAHLSANRIIVLPGEDADTVHFDILRTQILSRMQMEGWKTLAITSPTPGCGKTVVAINLALSIAKQTDKTALLADFDLRKPKVAEYLGLPEGKGITDYLAGTVPLSEILVNPDVPHLVVLPHMTPIRTSTETLTSGAVKSLVADLRDRYDSRIVIFDLPPLLASDDTIAFLPQVDCVLLVVSSGQSSPTEVKEAQRKLKADNLLGVVLNKSTEKHQVYY
ncbi:CpsD/CapB family tyrosine-protein kinase [Sneathiella chinensis]|uniref:non-specific protein-tyrosine kinase n=1 Tax=Sneathiella chinensis TaxID=349750 RepID=A0ABQ5U707_9PROT|nr:CpsD/CapB family tyrosine-protein kinase [Sneathiella chinensis]GLQ07937.1 chromosome partitioning protein [Sneathiella chinensis]